MKNSIGREFSDSNSIFFNRFSQINDGRLISTWAEHLSRAYAFISLMLHSVVKNEIQDKEYEWTKMFIIWMNLNFNLRKISWENDEIQDWKNNFSDLAAH